MCRLRLALLFCCGCMLLLIFIFTWHPLQEKILGEKLPRGLLSCDCEESFQVIPKEKLLLSTGVGWRVLEKSSLDCSGDGDGLKFSWTTVEMEYLDLGIANDIENISSSLPELYALNTHSELWPVMFFYFTFWKSRTF